MMFKMVPYNAKPQMIDDTVCGYFFECDCGDTLFVTLKHIFESMAEL